MSTRSTSREDALWLAIEARSPEYDGRWYYGVKTTAIFCKPSCPSRRPRRENVEFFPSSAAAEASGYRACKRCRPADDDAPDAIVTACRLLESEEPVKTQEVARAVGLSGSYFQRAFKKRIGITPQQYRRRVLADRARGLLRSASTVTESIYAAGYSSSSRFYAQVGKDCGMKPSIARAGGPGERIAYAVSECSLGHLLIAWTDRGVCDVAFGDDAMSLERGLEARYPKAEIAPGQHVWVDDVVRVVERGAPAADIPLDIRGTAFQERVWQLLRSIPPGETRSYAEIATALGKPSAVRAVAQACAANRLAVLVPCHRVVRSDGALSGYRWGADRKVKLLRCESDDPDEKT